MKFDKPALSIHDQISLLKSRGLEIQNPDEAAHYLRFIGYYRLSGYGLPLSLKSGNGTHQFKPGATFENILNLYRFDRELRLLVMDAIERVEVAFRTGVSNAMAEKWGPHWFLGNNVFDRSSDQVEFGRKIAEETGAANPQKQCTRGRDVFIEHYFKKYGDPPLPPTWMVAEVLSISAWSKCFSWLRREDRKRIAASFLQPPEVLESWIHSVCYVRNLCAHHSRLWNREFTIRPMIAKAFSEELSDNSRFFAQAFVINVLLKVVSPDSKWWDRLLNHIRDHAFIDPKALGFSTKYLGVA